MRISPIQRDLREALGDDPRLALAAVRRLPEADLPWLEARAVRDARWLAPPEPESVGCSGAHARASGSGSAISTTGRSSGRRKISTMRNGRYAAARTATLTDADRRRRRELDAWAVEGGIVPW